MKISLLCFSILSFCLTHAASNPAYDSLEITPNVSETLETILCHFYSIIADQPDENTGLAAITRGLYKEGHNKIKEDADGLKLAKELLAKIESDETHSLLVSAIPECNDVTQETLIRNIRILGQKNLLLSLNQKGVVLQFPEGKLADVFGPESQPDLAKLFFACNRELPVNSENFRALRGTMLAQAFFIERIKQEIEG